MDLYTIVFVCTGNTCRSPMAEWMTRKQIAKLGLEDQVQVFSAGVSAWPGAPISEGAKAALERRDVSGFAEHRAVPISADLLEHADLILTLSESHRLALFDTYPQYVHKMYTLIQYAFHKTGDIVDPFGGSDEAYEQAARVIEEACRLTLIKVQSQLGKV